MFSRGIPNSCAKKKAFSLIINSETARLLEFAFSTHNPNASSICGYLTSL